MSEINNICLSLNNIHSEAENKYMVIDLQFNPLHHRDCVTQVCSVSTSGQRAPHLSRGAFPSKKDSFHHMAPNPHAAKFCFFFKILLLMANSTRMLDLGSATSVLEFG